MWKSEIMISHCLTALGLFHLLDSATNPPNSYVKINLDLHVQMHEHFWNVQNYVWHPNVRISEISFVVRTYILRNRNLDSGILFRVPPMKGINEYNYGAHRGDHSSLIFFHDKNVIQNYNHATNSVGGKSSITLMERFGLPRLQNNPASCFSPFIWWWW